MSDGLTLTYEICVLKSGRWELHANYTPVESVKCVEDAKRLYKAGRHEGVRVVEDTYDPGTKTHEETVVYDSPRREPPKPVKIRKDKALRVRQSKTVKRPMGKFKRPTVGREAPKFLIIGLVSFAVAGMVSYAAIFVLRQLQSMDVELGKGTAQALLIGVFIASAIALFVPLMRRFGSSLGRASADAPAENSAAVPQDLPQPPPLAAEQPVDSAEEPDEEAIEDFEEPEEGAEDDSELEEPEPAAASSAEIERDLLKFIEESLVPLAAAGRSLDAFNRFGLTLYFAGAGEYLAARDGVRPDTLREMLSTHVQLLGHSPDMARGFCGNIDEYLVNPKYFQMYEAGRGAIVAHLQDPESGTGASDAMDFWNEPASATSSHDKEFVAVLFTDIVGSTALTQARGDDAAQLVVHAHNEIVRDALALHGGREIKHTGDGIMATFPQITSAVDGAAAIQQACQRASAADPELGLGICIGINAGEPIHEGGDIFGTPVQMAARVLSKAEGYEIAVSNIVREMCVGKSYSFTKKGDYELKGFEEPVPIFLVEWQGAAAEPGAAAA